MSDSFTVCPYCRKMESEIEDIPGEPGMVKCGICKKEFKKEEIIWRTVEYGVDW